MFRRLWGTKTQRQCPQTATFEEKGEPKRIRTEVPLLTSFTAKPNRLTPQMEIISCFIIISVFGPTGFFLGSLVRFPPQKSLKQIRSVIYTLCSGAWGNLTKMNLKGQNTYGVKTHSSYWHCKGILFVHHVCLFFTFYIIIIFNTFLITILGATCWHMLLA